MDFVGFHEVDLKCNVEPQIKLATLCREQVQQVDKAFILHLRLERSNGRLAALGLTTSTIVVTPFSCFRFICFGVHGGCSPSITSRGRLFPRPPQLWIR